MAASDIAAAMAAALKVEKRIEESENGDVKSKVVSPQQKEDDTTNVVTNKQPENSDKGDGGEIAGKRDAAKRKKRRSKAAAAAGSNWKKLKLTLDAETSKRGPMHWKKREFGKRPRPAQKPKPDEKQKGDLKKEEGMTHSAFAKRAVAEAGGKLTRVVALDCEMVEVAGGLDALARVSVVNVRGDVILDAFVVVRMQVTDYRTAYSGVTAGDIVPGAARAVELGEIRAAVGEMLRGRILVGHALRNDLRVLGLTHPAPLVRDTSVYFKPRSGRKPKLAALVAIKLGVDEFQKGAHDSAEDARAALALYKKFSKEWENSLRERSSRAQAKVSAKSIK